MTISIQPPVCDAEKASLDAARIITAQAMGGSQ
jgi:hypothetical protein